MVASMRTLGGGVAAAMAILPWRLACRLTWRLPYVISLKFYFAKRFAMGRSRFNSTGPVFFFFFACRVFGTSFKQKN